jgi:hypothetical protein
MWHAGDKVQVNTLSGNLGLPPFVERAQGTTAAEDARVSAAAIS